jgi:hypothetical protein
VEFGGGFPGGTQDTTIQGREFHMCRKTDNNTISDMYILGTDPLYLNGHSCTSFEIEYLAMSHDITYTPSALYRAIYYGGTIGDKTNISLVGSTHTTPREVVDSFTSVHGSVPVVTFSVGGGPSLRVQVTGLTGVWIVHSMIVRMNYISYP